MTTTYKGESGRLVWTNSTGSDVSSGDVVILAGHLVCVALVDIANGSSGTLAYDAKHVLTATSGEAWGVGQPLYCDVSASNALTADPDEDDIYAGVAVAAKASGATTATVDLRSTGGAGISGKAANAFDFQESVADVLDLTAAEPAAPSTGDRYLNTGTGSSSETSQTVAANEIVEYNGTDWTRITPSEGMVVLDEDSNELKAYNGSAWADIGTIADLTESATFFGATDISGSEAETLSDGSNADSLHVHTRASGLSDDHAYSQNAVTSTVNDATVCNTFVLEFDVDASGSAVTYTVPAGKALRVLDAWGYKKTANGAHADDDIDITDGSNAIFDTKELNGVNDGVRFTFANLDETHRDLQPAEVLTLTGSENGAGQGDALVQILCTWVTAS